MNPSFLAMQKAITQSWFGALMGVPHISSKTKLDQTDGALFRAKPDRNPDTGFPRSDMVVEAEKERLTRAHLDNLACEARSRGKLK